MSPLPLSPPQFVGRINNYDVWWRLAFEGFALQNVMLRDISSLSKEGEDDLPALTSYFGESVKERISAQDGKWSWRTRDSVSNYKSPYLEWLKSQWASGRWKNDQTINNSARLFLDPRYARFESLAYMSGNNNLMAKSWPDVVKAYRDLCAQDAARIFSTSGRGESAASKRNIEKFVLDYFSEREWGCDVAASHVGNILIAQRPLADSGYMLRMAFSVAGRTLLDHIDCWLSVVPDNTDLRVMGGGPSALASVSVGNLLFPAAIYYMNHAKNYARIVNAIALIDSAARALVTFDDAK